MESKEQTFEADKDSSASLADELEKLQAQENKGQGVTCIKQVVIYLRMGRLDDARQICVTDSDKIDGYPKLKDVIINKLFAKNAEHPWSVYDRLQQQTKRP